MAIGKMAGASAAKKTAAKRKARYGGIKAKGPRNPIPHVGKYRFRVVSFVEGEVVEERDDMQNVKLELEVVDLDKRAAEHHAVGDILFNSFRVAGPGCRQGRARMKDFIVPAAGFESEAEYDEWDPDGYGIDAMLGDPSDEYGDDVTLVGRLVDAVVTRGNDVLDRDTQQPTGDYYRNFAWSPVDDDE